MLLEQLHVPLILKATPHVFIFLALLVIISVRFKQQPTRADVEGGECDGELTVMFIFSYIFSSCYISRVLSISCGRIKLYNFAV